MASILYNTVIIVQCRFVLFALIMLGRDPAWSERHDGRTVVWPLWDTVALLS